jgi:molybdopterin synthase catalytic subunit
MEKSGAKDGPRFCLWLLMVYLTKESLTPDICLSQLTPREQEGAIVSFIGSAKRWNQNREVIGLEFSAYEEMAEKKLDELAEKAQRTWSLQRVFLRHRIGFVALQEIIVVIITTAPHRSAAYEANSFLLEQIKKDVPIWEKESYADGSHSWIEAL